MHHVEIFDTTMRDGEQSPNATMTSREKIEVARALATLGVDVMEAGFPAASPDDFAAVHAVAQEVGTAIPTGFGRAPGICALARAAQGDIDKAARAVEPAHRGRIHIFLATSPIHREHKLRMNKRQVVEAAHQMVAYARQTTAEVEFSAEDATRTEADFLAEVCTAVIEAGGTHINIPDTVGYTYPAEYHRLITQLLETVPGIRKAVLSVHCHNDLGLAVANTLAGVQAGARQVEVTINGIGERAGNAALEEVVMALKTRRELFECTTAIETTRLAPISRLVSQVTGMMVQPNKAIVGRNAFAHEAGIHQDGMLKARETYEIMTPESVGVAESTLVLGKHSGRAAFKARAVELGFDLDEKTINEAFVTFKQLADQKKYVTDNELRNLLGDKANVTVQRFDIVNVRITSSTNDLATAAVSVRRPDGEVHTQAAVGKGPVDAAFNAIDCIVQSPAKLIDYQVKAISEGADAEGEARVRIMADGSKLENGTSSGQRVFRGSARSHDMLAASAQAYIDAHNSYFNEAQRFEACAERPALP